MLKTKPKPKQRPREIEPGDVVRLDRDKCGNSSWFKDELWIVARAWTVHNDPAVNADFWEYPYRCKVKKFREPDVEEGATYWLGYLKKDEFLSAVNHAKS